MIQGNNRRAKKQFEKDERQVGKKTDLKAREQKTPARKHSKRYRLRHPKTRIEKGGAANK